MAASTVGCRESLQTLGQPPAIGGRSHGEELFGAFAARVTDPARGPKYDSARVRIAAAAVLPSRVWNDTSNWTSASASRRQLLVSGRFSDGRYRLDATSIVASPRVPADSRHVINLTRLADSEYAWDTAVPFAIGSITALEFGRFVGALLASAEGRSESAVRADYGSVLPRASVVLGQVFRVDSIRTSHLNDRSTIAVFHVSMTPEGVHARYPNFSQYLRKYIHTAKMRWTLTDHAGATYLECSVSESKLLFRIRTLRGVMVAIDGPARPMPDSLSIGGDMTVKVRHFTVGVRDYHADFNVIRTEHERAWSVVSRREPQWVLPLITERLLRSPLRRPFQGSGALFRIGVRDSAGAQTLLDRRLHLEVQESAILRFIGRLGAIAMSDFTGKVEREEMAWLREVFTAVLADLRREAP